MEEIPLLTNPKQRILTSLNAVPVDLTAEWLPRPTHWYLTFTANSVVIVEGRQVVVASALLPNWYDGQILALPRVIREGGVLPVLGLSGWARDYRLVFLTQAEWDAVRG